MSFFFHDFLKFEILKWCFQNLSLKACPQTNGYKLVDTNCTILYFFEPRFVATLFDVIINLRTPSKQEWKKYYLNRILGFFFVTQINFLAQVTPSSSKICIIYSKSFFSSKTMIQLLKQHSSRHLAVGKHTHTHYPHVDYIHYFEPCIVEPS